MNFCGGFKERGCKIFKEIRGGERHRLSRVPLFSYSSLSFRRNICAILYFSSEGKNIYIKWKKKCFACVWNMNNVSDEHCVFSINIHPSFYTFLFASFRIVSSFFTIYSSHFSLLSTLLNAASHVHYNHSPTPLEIYWNVWFDKNPLQYILSWLPCKILNCNKIYHVCLTRSNLKYSRLNCYGYLSTLNISEAENLFL